MGQDTGQDRPQQLMADDEKSAEQLRSEIEDVRTDLGDTAAALAAKTDVKARARAKADDVKQTAAEKKDDLLSKVGRGSAGGTSPPAGGSGGGGGAGATAKRLKAKAEQKPVLVAAAGALVGGFVLGRLSRRDG